MMQNSSKIAIISDIHANKYALEKFLNYIEENYKADKILNLGDFVHIGPHPKEVAQIIFNDRRFENIIGNNEMILLGKYKPNQGSEHHTKWTRDQLGDIFLEKIQKTPTSKTLTINGEKVLMLHSHFYDTPGRSIQDNLLIYEGKTLNEFLDDYPREVRIVLVGHSHEQLYISWKGKIIINPGSLSITWKPIISFCLMEIDTSNNINLEFKNISYDTSKLKNDYKLREVPEKDFIMKYFYPFL